MRVITEARPRPIDSGCRQTLVRLPFDNRSSRVSQAPGTKKTSANIDIWRRFGVGIAQQELSLFIFEVQVPPAVIPLHGDLTPAKWNLWIGVERPDVRPSRRRILLGIGNTGVVGIGRVTRPSITWHRRVVVASLGNSYIAARRMRWHRRAARLHLTGGNLRWSNRQRNLPHGHSTLNLVA